ncbi:two-component system protein A [Trichodelitschia bisporula]|uniref:Two-component system protein A n=1 Tax=Trichodelitschia bisporula TaxID=703511 RepID=A0A6G1HLX6_9PEZI|nr:two-component system protein A [Trichodelitschia bisporula]
MDQILTHSPIPSILLDGDQLVLQVSSSFANLIGRSDCEKCLGMDLVDVLEGASSDVCLPPVEVLQEAARKAVGAKTVTVIKNILTENGVYWSIRAVPIFDRGTLLFTILEFEDTTVDFRKLQALNDERITNETYRILVETVKDYAIFMLDTKGRVATWNSGAALLKGYKRDEIVGRHFSVFYGTEDRIADKPGKELVLCMRDGKVLDEGWRYRKDGSRFWASVTITAVYRSNEHIGFSKVTRDLTERKAAEARLISAYEESDRLKSEFLANMSHEIRTPMHGMLAALALLIETPLSSEQRELTSTIHESGHVLLQVINDILDYSKLAAAHFSLNSAAICVPGIIASVVRSYQMTLKQGVTLDARLDSNLPQTALGDELRYRQILQNLIGNAVKFTDEGSIHVTASLEEEGNDMYRIYTEVEDTGIGVADGDVKLLFSPFTQLDVSATKRHEGTGLGLSISKSLAELMGGEIGYRKNSKSQGSVFWFTVKMSKADATEKLGELTEKFSSMALPATPATRDQLKDVAKSKRLLLAEDNILNQKVMLKMLKNFGFENVDTAINGKEAVKLALQHKYAYDLILMDINMPVLDGVCATGEIKDAGVNVPIVAMTANALKGDQETYLAKGLDDYIPKPVDQQLLIQILLKWLTADRGEVTINGVKD